VEADETFVLQLRNPTGGATLGTPKTSTIVITDDDRSATLQFSAAKYTVVEAAGYATVTITRAGSTATPVSVILTTSDGTAHAGTDYTAVNVPVDFGVGTTSRTVAVPIIPNSTVDGARTVTLTLSGATAPAAVGARATAILTIVDDDSTLEFSAAGYSVPEGGTATITVRRIGSALGSIGVGYSVIGGSASVGSDYVVTSGRLTFGPGVMTQTFAVQTLVDAAVEGDETIQLTLGSPVGNATIGAVGTAILTVVDNPSVVKFGASTYSVTEGTAAAILTVVRTGPSAGTVTVDYARIGGTASGGGNDYTFTPGTLTFGPGVMSRTFSVVITNDTVPDTPETVVFQLSNAVGAMIGTPSTTTLTIQDNEPQVLFSSSAYTVTEGTPTVTLTVLRTGPTTAPVTVSVERIGGTASGGGVDHSFTPGTLTFAPGVASRTLTVAVTNDSLAEAAETVIFRLSNATNATIGTPSTATLTIVDNEAQVRFASASYAVTEGTPTIAIAVLRTGPTTGTATVDYAATGGTATSVQDYTVGGIGTLTFGPGVTTRTFSVAITEDTAVESGETIVLTLGNPVNATLRRQPLPPSTSRATTSGASFSLRARSSVATRG